MMQKGKKVHQQVASKPSNRRNISPKKSSQLFQQPNQSQTQSRNQKKPKINNLNLQTLNSNPYQNQVTSPKIVMQQKNEQVLNSYKNPSTNNEISEQSSRRYNPYQEMYKTDLKYYSEYLDSCQKITHNGINFKWPYCFYSGP